MAAPTHIALIQDDAKVVAVGWIALDPRIEAQIAGARVNGWIIRHIYVLDCTVEAEAVVDKATGMRRIIDQSSIVSTGEKVRRTCASQCIERQPKHQIARGSNTRCIALSGHSHGAGNRK